MSVLRQFLYFAAQKEPELRGLDVDRRRKRERSPDLGHTKNHINMKKI